jgi:uncharacterized protein YdaU (DUF1376 family)
MSKAPSMPMYWDAYLADTTHLTTEEHGAYMLLLAAMWRRNGSVPDDDKDNARILGLTPAKWRKTKARLLATISGFKIENDAITQEKLQKTWENTQEKITKNKANGAKGGRAAASKNNDLDQANATETVKPKATIPEPEPIKREAKASLSPTAKKSPTGSRLSQDWVLSKSLGDWSLDEGASHDLIRAEADRFKDYWIGVAGAKGRKADWDATWRNWIRKAIADNHKPQLKAISGGRDERRNQGSAINNEIAARFANGTFKHDPFQ